MPGQTDAKAMDAVKTYFPTIAARAANNPVRRGSA